MSHPTDAPIRGSAVGGSGFRVGDVEVEVLVHGRGSGTPAWMFPDAPPARRHELLRPYLDLDGEFGYVYASVLLRRGATVVLLDAGPAPAEPGARSSIEVALATASINRRAVDAVVLSHGHLDHLGGLVGEGRPRFPAARHLVHRYELDHWTTGAEADGPAAGVLDTVAQAGLLDVVEGETELLPGLRLLPTPGHTPGHLAVAIAAGGRHALYVGDVLAHEVNLVEPGWNHFSDLDGPTAARSRRRLVDRAARHRSIVVGSHLSTWGPLTGPDIGTGARDSDEHHRRQIYRR